MTLDQAIAKLKKDVQDTMANEMKEEVKAKHREAVQEDVYDAYEPTTYIRRYDLDNDENIDVQVSGYHLTLKNITPPKSGYHATTGKDLSQVIETGYGYDYDFGMARPFIQGTEDRIAPEADAIMAEGLGKRGWGC